MNEVEVMEALEAKDAVRRGHFKLSSGLHSDVYVQCALALQWPGLAERLGHELGTRFAAEGVEVVLAPAMGGLLIGHEVARQLGVRMVFAERVEGEFTLRRGFRLERGERAVVIEDVVTTGRSQREAMQVAAQAGAIVVGVGAVVDRSAGVGFGVRFEALTHLKATAWEPGVCPLCAAGQPVSAPGSRHLAAGAA